MTSYLELPAYQQRSVSETHELKSGLANGVVLSLLMWTAIVLAVLVLH